MRWKAELPKMPRLPRVPPDAGSAALGPPPSPSAYRERNPSEAPPAEYRPPSMLAEHKGIALLFLAAAIAFGLYCLKAPGLKAPDWAAPRRSVAGDPPPQAGAAARGETAGAHGPATSQSPIYVEMLPDKER